MKKFDEILYHVRQPSRYLGHELHAQNKDPTKVSCRVALAYPDLYELGMSYLGLQVLYHAVNRVQDLWAERVFAPHLDMQSEMTSAGLPLCSLESRTPLVDFDLVGFTLQHELNYPDLLVMLQMGSIPTAAKQRSDHHPIVVAGGPCAANPEPLAPALDAVFLGDAEEGLVEMARIVGRAKRQGKTRQSILDELMSLSGVYIPSRYEVSFDPHGRMNEPTPLQGAPKRVRRRLIGNIDEISPPARTVVPCSQTVHDRLAVEIQRGCSRGCRFCQAGMINRPVRQRSVARILEAVSTGLERTGYEQASFLSLSAGDHPHITHILEGFFERHAHQQISASLPSLRAETLTPKLAQLMSTVRKSGFTIAPEAGSIRLRRVINKPLCDEDVIQAVVGAFETGWNLIKLYFMVGLPTEGKEDRQAVLDLVTRIKKALPKTRRKASIHVGLSIFVPKPHTPFQWEPMLDPEKARQIHQHLRKELLRLGGVRVGWTKTEMSWAEGLLSRGDRRQFEILKSLAQSNQRLAGWSEHFRADLFERAFGQSAREYLLARSSNERLPWDHLDMGPDRDFLWSERNRAYAEELTPDCTQSGCTQCGACFQEGVLPVLDTLSPPAVSSSRLKPDKICRKEKTTRGKRIRLRLAKTGPAVHLGHIDTMQAIRRALRRAAWPLGYTQGFHPKPKVSYGPACPVGIESMAEMVDVTLARPDDPDELLGRLRANLPAGVKLITGRVLPEDAGSIMKEANAVRYRIHLGNHISSTRASAGASRLMQRREWKVTRLLKGKSKTIDVRPTLLSCEVQKSSGHVEAICELALNGCSSARPTEVAQEAFGISEVRVVREAILFDSTCSPHERSNPSTAPGDPA